MAERMSAIVRHPFCSWLGQTGLGWLFIIVSALPGNTHSQDILGAAFGGAWVAWQTASGPWAKAADLASPPAPEDEG